MQRASLVSRLFVLSAVFSGLFSTPSAVAQTTWTVTSFTDTSFATLQTGGGFGPGVGSGSSGDLRYVLFQAMATGGANTITFPGCTVAAPCTIVLGQALPPIFEATANTGATAPANFSLTINGGAQGAVLIDGNSSGLNTTAGASKTNRVFWVDNVAVTLANLVVKNATAQGGSSGGGGTGAGFGAGLFVNQATAQVGILNSTFLNCVALGGASSSNILAGGGGMGGSGGLGGSSGGGGGGVITNGSSTEGVNGGNGGAGGGGGGASYQSVSGTGGNAYAANTVGGNGGNNRGGDGGFGGGGGGGANGGPAGGNGGFGGGGGNGGSNAGGNGGFGGGGGGAGGGSKPGGSAAAVGGISGGVGNGNGAGGGGAAAGPAIFVVNGSVTLYNTTGSGFTATAGAGGGNGATAGTADATGVFNYAGVVNGSTSVGPIRNAFTVTTAVGQTSATQTATLTFTTATTVSTALTINLLTQGVTGLDFAFVSGGTCATATAYAVGATCRVQYSFAPKFAGLRTGGITLTDAAGNLYASANITGTGTGPQATFPAGSVSSLGSGLSYPNSVAIDGSGNLYVADGGNNAIKKFPYTGSGYGAPSILASGLKQPFGVALDGSGNVYFADTNNSLVKKISYSGGVYATPVTLGSGFTRPFDITVDGSGNVYFTEPDIHLVIKLPNNGGTYGTPVTVGSGFTTPIGVAVDGSGNLYVGDTTATSVMEVPLGSGTSVPVGSGLNQPYGVAVDGGGNVYVADSQNSLVKKIPYSSGSYGAPVILGSGFSVPLGVSLDGSGNVYVGDVATSVVKKIDLVDTPSLTFPTATADGATDTTDGARTATLANNGNQPLVFSVPTAGTNPSVSSGYTLATESSANCPQLSTISSATSLAAGNSCTLPVSFTPVAGTPTGTVTGQIVVTDNALNATPATQTIALTGSAIGPPTTALSITNAPSTASVAASFNLTVNALDKNGNVNPAYRGTVSFSSSDNAATLPGAYQFTSGDAGTHTFTATLITTGKQTITATDSTNGLSAQAAVSVSLPGLVVTTAADDLSPVDQCGSSPTNGPTACRLRVLTTEITNCPIGNSPASNNCSLRDALATATALGSAKISFDPTVFATAQTISLVGQSPLSVTDYTTIQGPRSSAGALLVSVDGGNQRQVFNVNGNGIVLDSLIVQHGSAGNGGGIGVGGGSVTVSNSTFTGNSATQSGGAIQVSSGTLTVNGSTFSGNSGGNTVGGGGLACSGVSGVVTVNNSTFYQNSARFGGAIYNDGCLVTLSNSTLTGNSASDEGGAIEHGAGTLQLINATVSGNSSGYAAGIYANTTVNLYNSIITDSNVATLGGSNIITTGANLSALGNYGGPTQTMVPLPGSTAICAGATKITNVTVPTTDQRGVAHSSAYCAAGRLDAGAVQTSYAIGFGQQPTNTVVGQSITPSPTVSVTENGLAQNGTIAMTASVGTLSGTTSQATSSGVATFGGLSISPAATSDTLKAKLTLNAATDQPTALSATSNTFNVTTPAPTVTSISPTGGPLGGGVPVTIAGTNFVSPATVKFGGVSATGVSVPNATTVNAIAPASALNSTNTVDVTVTTANGTSATSSADLFTYYAPQSYTVTTLTDDTQAIANANYATRCAANSSTCTLRDAIAAANTLLSGVTATVSFAPALTSSASAANPAVYTVTTGGKLTVTGGALLTINGPVDGNGKNLLAVDGGSSAGVFDLYHYGGIGSTTLSRLILRNGGSSSPSSNGGGIYVGGGTVAVTNTTVSGNTASIYGVGAGIFVGGGAVTLTNTTISGNSVVANGLGGGIFIQGGTMTLTNATVSGNSSADGSGLVITGSASVTLTHSTVSGNQGGNGVVVSNGTLKLVNDIVVDSISGSYNNAGGNVIGIANLGPLGNYGGPTQTLLPLPGSAAICAATVSNLSPAPASNQAFTDQRGATHGATYCTASQLDAGAVQTGYAFSFTTQPPTTPVPPGTVMSPSPTVTISENGTALTAGAVAVSITDTASDLTSASTKSANSSTSTATAGQASFTNLLFTGPATNDKLTAAFSLNPNLATPLILSTVSNAFNVGQISQTITGFNPSATGTYGQAAVTLSATGGASGNAVTFKVTGGPGTITSGNQLTFTGAGTVYLEADQLGNITYSAAPAVTAQVVVSPATLTVSIIGTPTITYNGTTVATLASSNYQVGGLVGSDSITVTQTVGSYAAATAGAEQVTVSLAAANFTANGQTLLTNYTLPTSAIGSGQINVAQPTLAFSAISAHTYGDAPFVVSATSASNGAVTYGVQSGFASVGSSTGLVTLTGAGQVTLTALQAATTNYLGATATPVTITIGKQQSSTSIGLSATAITPLQSLTITATVSPAVAGSTTPTQTVTFFDGSTTPATQLGSAVPLSNGTARLNISLQSGTHTLYVVYSGDTNYVTSTSATSSSTVVNVAAEDFTFTATGSITQSVVPGTAGTYTFLLTQLYDRYPAPVTFTVTGLPPGATYTITPSSVAANGGPQTVTLTINTPLAFAMKAIGNDAPWTLALLLPLLLFKRARKKVSHTMTLASLLTVSTLTLIGCAGPNGFFGQSVQNYTVTVTGTSGTVSHSATISLQVQ